MIKFKFLWTVVTFFFLRTQVGTCGMVVVFALSWVIPWDVMAEEKVLTAHIRHRPPYMIVQGQFIGGALKEIMDLAADHLGYRIEWRDVPFSKSIEEMKSGSVDIVPRTISTPEREGFVQFLTPVGSEQQEILFLVRKGREQSIRNYDDLKAFIIGTKKGTSYFPRFDQDVSLTKRDVIGEDYGLINQFISGDLDTVIVLDRRAMDSAMAGLGFRDYGYAQYRLIRAIDLNYGFSKKSPNAALADVLDRELQAMIARDEIPKILARFSGGIASSDLAMALTVSEKEWLAANPGPFLVRSEVDLRPLNFVEDNRPQGFSIDYMDLLATRLAIPIRYVQESSGVDSLQGIKNGELDCVLNPPQVSAATDAVIFTSPYPGSKSGIALPKSKAILRDLLQKAMDRITLEEMKHLQEKWPGVQFQDGSGTVSGMHPGLDQSQLDQLNLTDAEKNWIKQHPKVRMGVNTAYLPFETTHGGAYTGMTADTVALLRGLTGLVMEPEPIHSWTEGLEAARRGEIDVIPAAMSLDDRVGLLLLTDAYAAFPVVIVTHRDGEFVGDLNDLEGRKVGVVRGYPVAEKLEKNYRKLRFVPMDTITDALVALEVGQIDAFVENLAAVSYVMNHLKMDQLQIIAPTSHQLSLFFGVRPDWPELQSILKKALANISPREKNAIRNSWMAVQVQIGSDLKSILVWVVPVGAFLFLVIIIVILWNRRLGREIAERERVQRALAAETSLLETVLSSIHQGLVAYDGQLRLIVCNRQFQNLFNLPESLTVPGSSFDQLMHHFKDRGELVPADQALVFRHHLLYGVLVDDDQSDYTCANGLIINVKRGSLPAGGFVGTFVDVSVQKHAKIALEMAEERSRLLLESVGEGIFGVDKGGRFNFINSAGAAMLGFEADDLIGKTICLLIDHYDHGGKDCLKAACSLRQAIVQETVVQRMDEFFWRRDGRSFPVEYTSRPIFKEKNLVGSVVVFRDITERIQIEQKIKTLSSAVEQSPVSIVIVDPSGRIEYVNPTFTKVSGYSIEESIGKNPRILKSGKMAVEVYHDLWATLKRGETWEGEFLNRRKNGELYWESTTISPIRDRSGQVIHFLANKEDITLRKKAESQLHEAMQLISSSIRYASRIQRSILPPAKVLSAVLPDHFVLWEPRDMVGGDMYWYRPWIMGALLLLGDCTGHGVPGAFITLIANGALDQALLETPPGDTATLLQRMHQLIQSALGQDREGGVSDDGLELGACYLDPEQKKLTFSGARFSLFVAEGEVIREIKGNKSGVGYRGISRDVDFSGREVELRPEWTYYMVTDGLFDQVGGETGYGFGKKRFIQLLESLQKFPINQQGECIKQALVAYRGEGKQRDDMSVIGFKGTVC